MALSLTNADAALKEFYLPAIRKQLNDTNKFLAQIDRNSKDVEGRRAVLSLHVSRNSGVGARGENGQLPTAGNQGYVEERVGMHYNYGRIQVSGPVIRAMKSDRGSFTRAIQSETKGLLNDTKRDVNRQLWGTSNGVIATCGVTAASTTVTLASTTSVVKLRQLEIGMKIDIGTVANPISVAQARTITAVDFVNKTITIDGAAVTTAGTDFIFRSGAGGTGVELTGIQTIVDDSGTLFNVDPTTYPIWKSNVFSNSGTNRPVSENLFERVIMESEIVSGSEGDDVQIWVSDGVFRAVGDMLTAMKRFNNTLSMKGGFSAVSMQVGGRELGLTWERDVPANRAYFLAMGHLTQHEQSDWEWMDRDGAVLNRVPNTDAYEATLFKYHELTTDKRNAHSVLEDLTEA